MQPRDTGDAHAFPWPFDPAFSLTAYALPPDATTTGTAAFQQPAEVQPTMNPQFMNQQFGWAQTGLEGMWGAERGGVVQAQGVGAGLGTGSGGGSGYSSWTPGAGVGIHQSAPPRRQEPTPSVLHHHGTSFLPAAAAHLSNGHTTSTGKPPPPHVEFGKRSHVALKVFDNGEPRLHRRVIRYGLEIVQQPVQGKTFTERDRRAIVHPPVVRLWLVESVPVNPEMAGFAESLPYLLEDDSFWRDTLVDVSAVDTAGYLCIVDALVPSDEKANPVATDPTDPNALLPSGYKLFNVVPTTTPETRSLATLMASPGTISPDQSDVPGRRGSEVGRRGSGVGRMDREAVSRRPSTRSGPKSIPESAEGGVNGSQTTTREASSSSGDSLGERKIDPGPRRTDSIVSSALPTNPESSPHTSAPSKSSSGASSHSGAGYKRNLMGNWAVGCRKMYGMGTPDDLGIWFVFTDVSIQQPGKYALRFRCFNLHDAQMTMMRDTPPPPYALEGGEPEGGEGQLMEVDSELAREGLQVKGAGQTSPRTTGTASTPEQTNKTEARPLCQAQSADFTVYGMKGMPPWPPTSELTSYFMR